MFHAEGEAKFPNWDPDWLSSRRKLTTSRENGARQKQ